MIWATILEKIVGILPEKVVGYYQEKNKLKHELKVAKLKGKIDIAQAKVNAAIKQQGHIQTWEQTYVNMQSNSLKDEVVLGVLLIPYVGAFIPVVQDYIMTGFKYLDNMPYWAVGLTVTVMLAIYGIRHKNANRISAPGLKDTQVEPEASKPFK